MNTQSFKRYIVQLFAFFLMLAAAGAVETVSKWKWQVMYPEGTKFSNVQFSKTDRFVVACDRYYFYFFNPTDGNLIKKIDARRKDLVNQEQFVYGTMVFINNDQEFLLESQDRKTIDCYSTSDFKKLYSLEDAGGEIFSYALSKDEKYIVAAVGDKNLKLWNLANKSIIASYTQSTVENEMNGWIAYPGFTPDGIKIITGYHREVKTGTLAYPPFYSSNKYDATIQFDFNLDSTGLFQYQNRFVWSKSGNYLSTLNQHYTGTGTNVEYFSEVVISNALTNEEVNRFPIPYAAVIKYFFTNDEEYLVVVYGMSEDICRVFRIKDGVNTINYHPGNSNSGAALSNSGSDVIFATENFITIYDFSSTSFVVKDDKNTNISISPNPLSGIGIIKFYQDKTGIVNITISDELGNLVNTISNTEYEAGEQIAKFDVSELPNGAYFISVKCNNQTFTQQIIVNK